MWNILNETAGVIDPASRFAVHLSQFAFLDAKMRWVVEPSEMDMLVGPSS